MSKSDLQNRRYLLGNPYAHLEQLEAHSEAIRASRRRLEDPYAYLDGDGHLSALEESRSPRLVSNSYERIEQIAIELQRRLWSNRRELWQDESRSPIEVLDVIKAAKLIGFQMEFVGSLGVFFDQNEQVSVAGLIDRSKRSILISGDSSPPTRNFTAAHELGHALLHPHLEVMHRDRPLSGVLAGRDRVELEADKFATYFLMPEKLVRAEFAGRFLTNRFVINEDTAFALSVPLERSLKELGAKRKLARHLSSATHYNGQRFYSMAEHFNVTVESMAIRLEELQLI